MEERRNREDLIELGLFKTFKFKALSCVTDSVTVDEVFTIDGNKKGTTGHCIKLSNTE